MVLRQILLSLWPGGPCKISFCAITRPWENRTRGCHAGPVQLCLNGFPQVLKEMKSVRHLSSLRRAVTTALCVKTAAITANKCNIWMLTQPIGGSIG